MYWQELWQERRVIGSNGCCSAVSAAAMSVAAAVPTLAASVSPVSAPCLLFCPLPATVGSTVSKHSSWLLSSPNTLPYSHSKSGLPSPVTHVSTLPLQCTTVGSAVESSLGEGGRIRMVTVIDCDGGMAGRRGGEGGRRWGILGCCVGGEGRLDEVGLQNKLATKVSQHLSHPAGLMAQAVGTTRADRTQHNQPWVPAPLFFPPTVTPYLQKQCP